MDRYGCDNPKSGTYSNGKSCFEKKNASKLAYLNHQMWTSVLSVVKTFAWNCPLALKKINKC